MKFQLKNSKVQWKYVEKSPSKTSAMSERLKPQLMNDDPCQTEMCELQSRESWCAKHRVTCNANFDHYEKTLCF
jgi:hypothetical protein